MSGSRVPGLILPGVLLLALVVGVFWYWRHRDDDCRRPEPGQRPVLCPTRASVTARTLRAMC